MFCAREERQHARQSITEGDSESMSGGAQHEAGIPYKVSIHRSSSGIELRPSPFVDNSGFYRPSAEVKKRVVDMWNHRSPRAIGSASEMMATEILTNARISIDGCSRTLICDKLGKVQEIAGMWKPKHGIYCDDLVATAEIDGDKSFFPTEVKGTTLQAGLSHSSEAKMFYQLGRTCYTLKRLMPPGHCHRIEGVITVVIVHSWRTITINVLNEVTARGFFPDRWMYPDLGAER